MHAIVVFRCYDRNSTVYIRIRHDIVAEAFFGGDYPATLMVF